MSIRIALADDHQLVRKGIRLLLENIKGFNVVCEAANGKELIDKLQETVDLPDLVLVDVNMPVMDGPETVKALRSTSNELKIVALSVNDQLPVIRELIRLGANAYLFKDSSPEVFRSVLMEVYEKGFYYSKEVVESLMLPENSAQGGRNQYSARVKELTNRETEFVRHSCSELTYKEIADIMGVSQRTVDGYRESVFQKLEVKSRTGLVLFAINAGIYHVS